MAILNRLAKTALLLGAVVAAAPLAAEPGSGGDFTVAVSGDLLGPYRAVTPLADGEMNKVIALIRSADVAFANQEGSVFDLATFAGSPAAQNGGGTPVSRLEVAREMKAMGFDLLAKANNHATDWGIEGMMASIAALEGAGLVTAGAGANEAAARAPRYFETPQRRFALVAAASTYTSMSPAGGPGVKDGIKLHPRAGISVLRTRSAVRVAPAEIETLQAIAARSPRTVFGGAPGAEVTVGEQAFVVSADSGIDYRANEADAAALEAQVRAAKATGAFVIFSIHAHETDSGDSEDVRPANFLQPLFHRLVDAGADMIIRHGPHALLGAEIYKGRPIFYGMGSIYFDFGSRRSLAMGDGRRVEFPDSWYESAVATASYRDGKLDEIQLHPVMLESSDSATSGAPRPATGADALRILGTFKANSRQFGTVVDIAGGVARIRAGASL